METLSQEPLRNVMLTCSDCTATMYPNKGKLSPGVGDFAKVAIAGSGEVNKEHIWIIVTQVKEDRYEGIVDNDPIFSTQVKYEDTLVFWKNEIEDVLSQEAQKS